MSSAIANDVTVVCFRQDEGLERAMRANIIKVGGKPYTTYTYEDSGREKSQSLVATPERPFPRFSKQPKPQIVTDATGRERNRERNSKGYIDRRIGDAISRFLMLSRLWLAAWYVPIIRLWCKQ